MLRVKLIVFTGGYYLSDAYKLTELDEKVIILPIGNAGTDKHNRQGNEASR